jgi:hypothetical protein
MYFTRNLSHETVPLRKNLCSIEKDRAGREKTVNNGLWDWEKIRKKM